MGEMLKNIGLTQHLNSVLNIYFLQFLKLRFLDYIVYFKAKNSVYGSYRGQREESEENGVQICSV